MILVGEMRDLETVATALTAAETGHLVFATLHTQSAPTTIDRVIDVFPAEQQGQVRVQLASTLQGVVTQNLVPTADGLGRAAALEVLMPDDAVRNLIRQAKVEQIYSVMQTSTSRGMQTMEQSLADLVLRGVITPELAFARSSRPDQLQGLLERVGPDEFHRHRRPATATFAGDRPQPRAGFGSPRRCRAHMDLNKEIKLSDLVRRPKKKARHARRREAEQRQAQAAVASRRSSASRSAPPRSRPRGSSTTAPRSSCSSRAFRSSPAIVVGGEVRDVAALAPGARRLLQRQQASAPGHPARHRHQPHRRPHGRHRRHRRRAPARQRRSLQGARGALDPARPGRPRLPRRRRDGRRVRGRLTARPARGRLPGADRPLRRGVPARRASSSRASTSRRSRCCAPSRRVRRLGRRSPAPPRRRSRSVTTARRSRSPTATSATSRAFSTGAARSSRPRSRRSSGSPADEAPELKLELDLGATRRTATIRVSPRARAAVERELQTLARELVASLHFYQGQPGSLAISEVLVTGGTTKLPGLAEELERLTRVRVRIADPLAGSRSRTGSPSATTSRRSPPRSDWGWRADGSRQSSSGVRASRAIPGPASAKTSRRAESSRPAARRRVRRGGGLRRPLLPRALGRQRQAERRSPTSRRRLAVADAKAAPIRSAQAAAAARMTAAVHPSRRIGCLGALLSDVSRVLPKQVYLHEPVRAVADAAAPGAAAAAPTTPRRNADAGDDTHRASRQRVSRPRT